MMFAAQPAEVRYRINRPSLRRTFSLIVVSDARVDLPATILVAREGRVQPLDAQDGTVLGEFPAVSLSAGVEKSWNIPEVVNSKSACLRLFLQDSSEYRRIRVLDPPLVERRV
jgi:hypothetical protein